MLKDGWKTTAQLVPAERPERCLSDEEEYLPRSGNTDRSSDDLDLPQLRHTNSYDSYEL